MKFKKVLNVFFLLVFLSYSQQNILSHLISAIETNNLDLVKNIFIPQKKIDVNTEFPFPYGTEIRKMKPLMLAVLLDDEAITDFLLSQGADVNAVDDKGNSVLMYAIRPGNEKILDLLLKHNVRLDQARPDGITPLMMAAAWGYENLVRLLLTTARQQNKEEALLQMKDQKGKTALDYAKHPNIKNMLQSSAPAQNPQPQPAQSTQPTPSSNVSPSLNQPNTQTPPSQILPQNLQPPVVIVQQASPQNIPQPISQPAPVPALPTIAMPVQPVPNPGASPVTVSPTPATMLIPAQPVSSVITNPPGEIIRPITINAQDVQPNSILEQSVTRPSMVQDSTNTVPFPTASRAAASAVTI